MSDKKLNSWNANSYSQNSELQYSASKRLLTAHIFNGDETVLDIGCGHGRLTQEVSKKCLPNGSVIGIDNSESMIDYAKAHHAETNLEFILMDVHEISFSKKFDVIISTFCLHWAQDKALVFRNIARHLKENGKVLLIMAISNAEVASIRNSMMEEDQWSKYFKDYIDPQKAVLDCRYRDYAVESGLANINYELETVITKFESSSTLTLFLKNITACLTQLPNEELKTIFMNEIIHRYLVKNPASKNGECEISFTYAKLIAHGIKNLVKNDEPK